VRSQSKEFCVDKLWNQVCAVRQSSKESFCTQFSLQQCELKCLCALERILADMWILSVDDWVFEGAYADTKLSKRLPSIKKIKIEIKKIVSIYHLRQEIKMYCAQKYHRFETCCNKN
jgi:hypothetical protein